MGSRVVAIFFVSVLAAFAAESTPKPKRIPPQLASQLVGDIDRICALPVSARPQAWKEYQAKYNGGRTDGPFVPPECRLSKAEQLAVAAKKVAVSTVSAAGSAPAADAAAPEPGSGVADPAPVGASAPPPQAIAPSGGSRKRINRRELERIRELPPEEREKALDEFMSRNGLRNGG